jgi:hypothetical protein
MLKDCPCCERPISSEAETCPLCGQPDPFYDPMQEYLDDLLFRMCLAHDASNIFQRDGREATEEYLRSHGVDEDNIDEVIRRLREKLVEGG